MKKNQMLFKVLSILCLLSLLAACAPAATEAPAATDAPAATEPAAAEPVTLTMLWPEGAGGDAQINALTKAYTEKHPNVTFEIELRPGGADGDNLVKTRLATGEMADLFQYNSGSLFQALNPSETLVELTNEPFIDNVVESFFPTVSTSDGKIYGVPIGTALGGGIFYNKKIYAELGLSVPTTWEEFAANNEAIKAAGIAPVGASYGDTWTSQLFVLADYHNVEQANPTFADDYTNNKAKYASTPAALAGFQYLQEGFEKGWYQQDFATTTFAQAAQMLAEGKFAHYPMLSFVLNDITQSNPDQVNDIGFFAQPGTDASKNGATIWMPAGFYIPNTSQHIEEAKDFLAFVASTEGVDVEIAAVPPQGPYLIKGAELPDDVLPAVKDIAAYIDAGNSTPALEFLSPIKGPTLEQLCVAVGSGQMTAEEAAAAYDEDVKKQAQQLGLPGWDN